MALQDTAELDMCASGSATEPSESEGPPRMIYKIPIIEVAFPNGMWWSIPQEMSQQLYANFAAGKDAGYTWDWGDTRMGSYGL